MKILLFTFLTFGILVGTHLGEFWPLSIYPMFSKAGNPWTRALVRDIEELPTDSAVWNTRNINTLPGKQVSLAEIGVDQIDYSNFVSKTKNWNSERIQALRTMLGEEYLQEQNFMIYKVQGKLTDDDSVLIDYVPILYFSSDRSYFNPNFDSTYYFQQ
ncbi:hypothetical protein AB2B38_000395 [Balneola sp. MJW-20]